MKPGQTHKYKLPESRTLWQTAQPSIAQHAQQEDPPVTCSAKGEDTLAASRPQPPASTRICSGWDTKLPSSREL